MCPHSVQPEDNAGLPQLHGEKFEEQQSKLDDIDTKECHFDGYPSPPPSQTSLLKSSEGSIGILSLMSDWREHTPLAGSLRRQSPVVTWRANKDLTMSAQDGSTEACKTEIVQVLPADALPVIQGDKGTKKVVASVVEEWRKITGTSFLLSF